MASFQQRTSSFIALFASAAIYHYLCSLSSSSTESPEKQNPASHTTFNHTSKKLLRYKRMIPKLIMKKQMYDNVYMYDDHGVFLCTIATKKAGWYLRKELAYTWKPDEGEEGIRLKFAPNKSRSAAKDDGDATDTTSTPTKITNTTYETRYKENICCVCSLASSGYMRHYVVPSSYRTLLPQKFKSHLSHDIVILCPNCHVTAQSKFGMKMTQIERIAFGRVSIDARNKHIVDKSLGAVKNAATAILKYRGSMGAEIVKKHERLIRSHYNLDVEGESEKEEALSQETLIKASEMKVQTDNVKFKPGPVLVVGNLRDEEAIRLFVVAWRQFFVDEMKPAHMPEGWSVNYKVTNDRVEPNESNVITQRIRN